jgi:eukaryotic-like serine/threonine-protein kinase
MGDNRCCCSRLRREQQQQVGMQQKILNNRYELERKIGEGGMARVYIGRDMRLNRPVAIKIPHQQHTLDADFLNRFFHEAQAAAILQHPNIVDVYDVGQDGDIHYIVMEYVEGIDLKRLINREAPLPINQALHIGAQVARGLQAAHQAGMVHRDVKPQNIIVAPDNNVVITDFGIAKSARSTALTETGVVFGTADYISPEQAQGRTATASSDIYSVGVTLYEMLTGKLPFTGDTALAIAMKHVSDQPVPPRQINRAIPPQLEAIVLRCLAKDPAQRPQSATELARILTNFDQVSQQATVANAEVPIPRPPSPRPPQNNANTGRMTMPPPRPAIPARQPRQDGLGCGVFVVGMLVLAGVLGMVYLFATGAFEGLFTGPGQQNRPTAVVGATSTPENNATATPEPTVIPLAVVPDLTQQRSVDAQNLLRSLGLIPVEFTTENDLDPGLVVQQEVPANTNVPVGSPVTYTVSLGPPLIAVPDIRSIPQSDAQNALQNLGLQFEISEEPSTTIDAGFVISQSPTPNLRVPRGTIVRIVISQGDVVRFPDIIGLQRDQAEAILRATPGLEFVLSDLQGPDRLPDYANIPADRVVSAQIENGKGLANGEMVPRGSRIVLGVRAP